MNFLAFQNSVNAVLRRLNRQAYNDGVSGYLDEFQLLSITADKIEINCRGLSRDNIPSSHLVITESLNPNFLISAKLNYDIGEPIMECACNEVSGGFTKFHEGLYQIGMWIIDNVL